ncbi:MAG: a-glycosyltransferase-related protein glycosyltransferase family 4 protein [Bacteroidota bacterium]|jgi:glycosyltransferase involved in cell wall biosynthesis
MSQDPEANRPSILLSAYSLDPFDKEQGSNDWKLLGQIARFNSVHVVTRSSMQARIDDYLRKHPKDGMASVRFLYFDGGRVQDKADASGSVLKKQLWHYRLPDFIRKTNIEFDIVHHLGPRSGWVPSYLWKLGKPLVLGPIGKQPRVPRNYLVHTHGWSTYLRHELRWQIKALIRKSDFLFTRNLNHAQALITTGDAVLNQQVGSGIFTIKMPVSGGYESYPVASRYSKGSDFTVLAAGTLLPENGFDLAIRSFARFYHPLPIEEKKRCRLVIAGDGPDAGHLHRLVAEMELQGSVNFIPWMHSADMHALMGVSDIFLYAGMQGRCDRLADAFSLGLPVVCFKGGICGDHVNRDCGITVPHGRFDGTITRFAEAIRLLHGNPVLYHKLSSGARKVFADEFSWEAKGVRIQKLYDRLLQTAA